MALHPDVAARVAHLWDAHVLQLLSGEVEGVPPAAPIVVDGVTRTDATVPGPGGPIRVRWYRSDELAGTPAPALVWVHGGGWQYGDLDMPEADSVAQLVAAGWPGVVVSVDYRLAPRYRHPAALDDVIAAFRGVVAAGPDCGIDVHRLALGGGSAEPRHPHCPPVLWLGHEGTMGLFRGYLGDGYEGEHPVPATGDLSLLPVTLVTTAEADSLRAQAVHFVTLLRSAGVEVTHHDVEGVLHGYLNIVGDEPLADAALAQHLDWLRSTLPPRSAP